MFGLSTLLTQVLTRVIDSPTGSFGQGAIMGKMAAAKLKVGAIDDNYGFHLFIENKSVQITTASICEQY